MKRVGGATVPAIQGLVAKEQVVSSMSIIAGFGEEGEASDIFSDSSSFRSMVKKY